MSDDLVPLLRKRAAGRDALLEEAADEIERLRSAKKLIEAGFAAELEYRNTLIRACNERVAKALGRQESSRDQ